MCDKNINEMLNLIFSEGNDEFNWLNNTNNPIQTIDGKLVLKPESSESAFTRNLGNLDASNNRLNIILNLSVYRSQSSSQTEFYSTIEILNGSSVIDTSSIYIDEIEVGESIEYNFDRVYKYEGLSGAISIRITTNEGWQNEMLLDYIKASNFNYCDNDVRNFFVLDEFLENAITSTSSGIQLSEYKIDGIETLTADFFSDNNTTGANPVSDWFLAKANIDGSNRSADIENPNTFNPFISEFGLQYESANYYDGKPIGTITGNDYGEGVMNIGFSKPNVLNGNLTPKDGAFFIDIDFTKSLYIVFDVIVNEKNTNVFNSPEIYRRYKITWNPEKCSGSFSYVDQLTNIYKNESHNGFLSGLTGTDSSSKIIGCDEAFSYNGSEGEFSFEINFGTGTGMTGINFVAEDVPDKFSIEWNGQTYSSGYVGLNAYDQTLINLGISQSEINTGDPSTGSGSLTFNKDLAEPQTAVVRVSAPLRGTSWSVSGICPDGQQVDEPPFVDIGSVSNVFNQGDEHPFNVYTEGTIVSWSIQWGDEGTQTGTGTPPSIINRTFNTLGSKLVIINVLDENGLTASDTFSIDVLGSNLYTVSGTTFESCGSANIGGTLVVNFGQVTVLNRFEDYQGAPSSSIITINGIDLDAGESTVLGVGEYPFTSTGLNCSGGSGSNELQILSE